VTEPDPQGIPAGLLGLRLAVGEGRDPSPGVERQVVDPQPTRKVEDLVPGAARLGAVLADEGRTLGEGQRGEPAPGPPRVHGTRDAAHVGDRRGGA
jgi:hypothetical protein